MEALGIVDGIYEVGDGATGFRDVLEVVGTRFFGLECLHEALGLGIVVRIAGPAHGDGDVMFSQATAIVDAGILHTPV